jgi:hypothetical protein
LAKWGGVASPAVRRHWCGCVTAALDSIRAAGLELTIREKRIFKSLLERRDFWTDEQVKLVFSAFVLFFCLVWRFPVQPRPISISSGFTFA